MSFNRPELSSSFKTYFGKQLSMHDRKNNHLLERLTSLRNITDTIKVLTKNLEEDLKPVLVEPAPTAVVTDVLKAPAEFVLKTPTDFEFESLEQEMSNLLRHLETIRENLRV